MFNKIACLGSGSILDIGLSLNKQVVAVASVGSIAIHDVKTGSQLKQIKIDSTPVKIAISPNNDSVVYVTYNNQIFFVDLTTSHNQELLLKDEFFSLWYEERGFIKSISFSRDGNLIAIASFPHFIENNLNAIRGQRIIIWDVRKKKIKYDLMCREVKGPSGLDSIGVAFSPDSRYLVSWGYTSGEVVLWDLLYGLSVYTVTLPDYSLSNGTFSPDGKLIGFIGDVHYYIFDIVNKNVKRWSLFSEDAELNWLVDEHIQRMQEKNIYQRLPGYTSPACALSISSDNKFIAASNTQFQIDIWDIAKGSVVQTFTPISEKHYLHERFDNLSFSHDGRYLIATSKEGIFYLWDLSSNEVKLSYEEGTSVCGKFSPKGNTFAVGGVESKIKIFQMKNNKEKLIWEKEVFSSKRANYWSDFQNVMCYSPEGDLIATCDVVGDLSVWDVPTSNLVYKTTAEHLYLGNEPISKMMFTNNRELIINNLFFLDIVSGERRSLETKPDPTYTRINKMVLSPNLSQKALFYYKDIEIWDLNRNELITKLPGHLDDTMDLVFSKNGMILTSCGKDGFINIWSYISDSH